MAVCQEQNKRVGNHLQLLDSSEGTLATLSSPWRFLLYFLLPLFPAEQLFTVSGMLVFLFYSILLFSQVKYINYSSIFSFQSFHCTFFPAKCLSANRASKQGALQGETLWDVLTVKTSPILSLQEFRSKANRGGSPLQ